MLAVIFVLRFVFFENLLIMFLYSPFDRFLWWFQVKSNKELYAFLFNDFLLLTVPPRLLGPSVSASHIFDAKSKDQFKMYKTVSNTVRSVRYFLTGLHLGSFSSGQKWCSCAWWGRLHSLHCLQAAVVLSVFIFHLMTKEERWWWNEDIVIQGLIWSMRVSPVCNLWISICNLWVPT